MRLGLPCDAPKRVYVYSREPVRKLATRGFGDPVLPAVLRRASLVIVDVGKFEDLVLPSSHIEKLDVLRVRLEFSNRSDFSAARGRGQSRYSALQKFRRARGRQIEPALGTRLSKPSNMYQDREISRAFIEDAGGPGDAG